MNDQEAQEYLKRVMRELAAQTERQEPPPEIADAVLRHFAPAPQPESQPMWGWRRAVIGVAAAAAIAVAVLSSDSSAVKPPQVPEAAPFVALPYVIQPAVNEPIQVVRTEVVAAELIAVGLPLQGDPSARLQAEVLVGQDGRARAVRLLNQAE